MTLGGAVPKFCKAAPFHFAVKDTLENELERQIQLGILGRADYSEWASRLVMVEKLDKSMCSSGDFKPSVNPVLEVNQYPLPTPKD